MFVRVSVIEVENMCFEFAFVFFLYFFFVCGRDCDGTSKFILIGDGFAIENVYHIFIF